MNQNYTSGDYRQLQTEPSGKIKSAVLRSELQLRTGVTRRPHRRAAERGGAANNKEMTLRLWDVFWHGSSSACSTIKPVGTGAQSFTQQRNIVVFSSESRGIRCFRAVPWHMRHCV